MNTDNVRENYKKYLIPCYTMTDLAPVAASGTVMKADDGKEYLDFFPGWGVSSIGHAHPRVRQALADQAANIFHIQNNYYNSLQALLGKRIIEHAFEGKVLFTNSGAEANEVAIKIARKFGSPERYEIITMQKAFHGRTLATLAATGQVKHQKGFEPLPAGFTHVPFNDLEAVKAAINERTVAVMMEVVQGEGGINVADKAFMRQLRSVTEEKNILLIIDEVQTGIGRTGTMFGYQHYDIVPDIMCLAKALGGGFPIAATVARTEYADLMVPGTHGSTYGGSPLACACGLAVFDIMEEEKVLDHVAEIGPYFHAKLTALQAAFPEKIKTVRGVGMMFGLELAAPGWDIVDACRRHGLLINCTQEVVLRLMPALTVTSDEIDQACTILDTVFKE